MSSPPPPGASRTAGSSTPVRVGGRYVLRGEIGRGGMATVHRARDEVLERDVAVKLLHAHLASDPAFLDRFRREARASAALAHPNVVTVHDWGETDDGPFLVLQMVDGPSLRAVLRRRRRLLPAEAVAVLAPAALGLGAAHDAGLVHRDVKPENLLLGLDGTVRVTDFGLARAAASATSTFGTDVLVGSPHYLSPEAVRGEPLDPRADVYALGVVLSEVLTGRPPFEGDSPFATAVQHTSQRVPPPSTTVDGIPAALDEVVRRSTSPDRHERYADARAFAVALVDAVTDEGATVPGLLVGDDGVISTIDRADDGHGTAVLPIDAQDTAVAGVGRNLDDDLDDHSAHPVTAVFTGPSLWPPPENPAPDDGWSLDGEDADDLAATHDAEIAAAEDDVDEDDEDDDGDHDRDGTVRRRRWPLAVLLVTGLLAASAFGGYLLWDRVLAPVTAIPAVEEVTEDDAVDALEDTGFTVRIADERPYSLDIEAGRVLTQRPTGDARRGATVTLVVSGGPRPVEVVDVRGQSVADATAALEQIGLVVAGDVEERFDPDLPADEVLGTDPATDEVVDEASSVTLIVSRGPEPVPVPSLTGEPLEDAQTTLRDLGLEGEVGSSEFSAEVPAGAVLRQSVEDGTELLPGEVVELVLSDGPAPIEMPNLRGQRLEDAQAELADLGLEVEVEIHGGFGAFLSPGRVFEQDPGPGAERFAGDTVTLFAYES